ncbi:uncharacterized protein LOC112094546 [Morus notabilis]|uniref:uncharacterized protein LOC112094546 n=1 Tax=Morus notabilis TaxID=981085 RepID=UPI000CECEA1D|nr:uncharacterized protein LOC112094546 [Morus notabilis]
MFGPYQLGSLTLLLLFIFPVFLSSFEASVAAARPGFLYIRTTEICTPKYWSSGREAWPKMVPQTSTVSKVFGSMAYERYRSDLTLVEATVRSDEGNAFRGLLKQASAALLNSYARKGFPYTPWAVKTLVIKALVSEEAAALQAQHFYIANEACH